MARSLGDKKIKPRDIGKLKSPVAHGSVRSMAHLSSSQAAYNGI